MAKFVDCSKCGRKFSGLDAYLWHFKVVGGCPPEPAHGTVRSRPSRSGRAALKKFDAER
jgi:hypothetical protein